MLRKNIYLMYPPGYSGTYISWLLSKSELDSAVDTVDNPINPSTNSLYGGSGTAHLHHRNPTHLAIKHLMYWLVINKPTEKKIFLVNAWDAPHAVLTVDHIMNIDKDPVIIHLTASNEDTRALGNIHALIKWPLYFYGRHELYAKLKIEDFSTDFSIEARNSYVREYENCFPDSKPVDFDSSFYLQMRESYNIWYTMRNKFNPHEVNSSMYVEAQQTPKHYFNIDLLQIYDTSIINRIRQIMNETDSGDFNFDYAEQFHPTYVAAQQHIKYVAEISQFRKDKILTAYLCSHPFIEALVIREIMNQLPNDYHWANYTLREIVDTHNKYIL